MKYKIATAALALMSSVPAFAQEEPAGPVTISGSVALVSDYRFRGVSQTDKGMAVQGGITATHESGAYVGTWASNLGGWGRFGGSNMELDLFAGYAIPLGSATLESGTAQVLLPRSLAVGPHELTVDYLGNDDVEVATATATLTVLPEPRVDSSTTVRATPRRVERGAPVELRVTVRSARGGPDGELKVKLGGRRVALGPLVDARATITVPAKVRPGKRTFKVRFLGSDTARPSADTVRVKVVRRS